MTTPLLRTMSRFVGWAADCRIPRPLRAPVYRAYSRLTGADLEEVRLPLEGFHSLGQFFVRELVDGARRFSTERADLCSPVDGTVQSVGRVESGSLLQAKGRSYRLRDLLGGVADRRELDGGCAWTIYLSPRDYHRIHAPESCRLVGAQWLPGARYSVAPKVLDRRMVLSINERAVLELECEHGKLFLVLVGALNVGRIRVVGIDPAHAGPLHPPRSFARGAELARFEMGSTIVLVAPPGVAEPLPDLVPGRTVRLGQPIGTFLLPARAPAGG
jgi:phosphatidylserine decarboxylase